MKQKKMIDDIVLQMEAEENGPVYTPSTPMAIKQSSDDTSVISTITYGSVSASKSSSKKVVVSHLLLLGKG